LKWTIKKNENSEKLKIKQFNLRNLKLGDSIMILKKEYAEIFVPDNKPIDEALSRTTHMSIAAHQDDIEIMSYHGISQCFGRDDSYFFGVVVTNGSGSPRDNLYASYTDEEMQKIRKNEQKKAAQIGEYGALAMLDYKSAEVKNASNNDIVDDLIQLIIKAKPNIVYTHNLADKHDTHVSVGIRTINALRQIPDEFLPEKLYGCEVWRSLDWLLDSEKVCFDVSAYPNIASSIIGIFDSQISGGKRYDLATLGRWHANATYARAHNTDKSDKLSYGMDLTPLIKDKSIDISNFILGYLSRFNDDVLSKISRFI
jgi:LmbE family N-acetylglucosaminyl deacetylase